MINTSITGTPFNQEEMKRWYGGSRPRYRTYIHNNGSWWIYLRTGARLSSYLKFSVFSDTKTSQWHRVTPLM